MFRGINLPGRLRLRAYFTIISFCVAVVSSFAESVDSYGGWTQKSGNNVSGYFRSEKIDGRYWLTTPENHVFWSAGLIWSRFTGRIYESPDLGYSPIVINNRVKYGNSTSEWLNALR